MIEPQVGFVDTKILAVDDGDSNRELVGLLLRRSGAQVEFAENGQMAIECCKKQDYDAVLMDMQMPVMDGFTATGQLRKLGFVMPIIALTANAMPEDEMKCCAAGCDGFISKPINSQRLYRKLAELLPEKVVFDSPSHDTQHNMVKTESRAGTRSKAVGSENADDPLETTLPIEDDDFRRIVEMFVARLRLKVVEMQESLARSDLEELADLGHWLKGAGGSAGYDEFSAPAKELEQFAKGGNIEGCNQSLAQIVGLANRIRIDIPESVNPVPVG